MCQIYFIKLNLKGARKKGFGFINILIVTKNQSIYNYDCKNK